MQAPIITGNSWGRIEIDGIDLFKDVKLAPGLARAWDWSETGTRHSPGVQIADVSELVDAGATDIVLSRGRHQRLGVPDDVVEWLRAQGCVVHVLPTDLAIGMYNSLAPLGRTGALIHSTC